MSKFSNIFSYLTESILNPSRREKILEQIRQRWEGTLKEYRDPDLLHLYHHLRTSENYVRTIDDKTWNDLNMEEVFSQVDTCVSIPGAQYLYHKMKTYNTNPSTLKTDQAECENLRTDKATREKIQLVLNKLKTEDAGYIPNYLFELLPEKPSFAKWLRYSALLSFISTLGVFFFKPLLIIIIMTGLINIVFRYTSSYSEQSIYQLSRLYYMNVMLSVAINLSKLQTQTSYRAIDYLKNNGKAIEKLHKSIGRVKMEGLRSSLFGQLIAEYLNHFFLFDILAFIDTAEKLKNNRLQLIETFDAVASLDASIAIASYLQRLNGNYTVPDIQMQNIPSAKSTCAIQFKDVYHPLIESPVTNSLLLNQKSALITGSNMAGKTTFIKTIGVNIILAQTLFICLAKKSQLPFIEIKTLMRREDSIEQGKSYYMAEVEQILEFINLNRNKNKKNEYLFLLDEIYRGTNTIERIATSAAVLESLAKNGTVLATTHDIELQEILQENYLMFHFSEQVNGDEFYFDYHLTEGPCNSRNAIKLLELVGYPQEIINEAYCIATANSTKEEKRRN